MRWESAGSAQSSRLEAQEAHTVCFPAATEMLLLQGERLGERQVAVSFGIT